MSRSDVPRPFGRTGPAPEKGDLPPGTTAGAYLLVELIARGGCSCVYRAEHRKSDRIAAVKVLHASLAVMPKMVERFAREVAIVKLLGHTNIVEIDEVGLLPSGQPFYVMEHLDGRTLSAILAEQGRLSVPEALEVMAPVCSALQAAHGAGVIHRDVKASNIMVTAGPFGKVKLLDFGIAKLIDPREARQGFTFTSEGRQLGTLTAMAPEQLLGVPVDHRIDVYALGVLLYRLLTGRLPFDARSPAVLAQKHLEEPAPRPSRLVPIPSALDSVVLRCMEKRPERRYDSVSDFLTELEAASGEPVRRPTGPPSATGSGIAIYVEIVIHESGDELDEAITRDVSAVLDAVEDTLVTTGFTLVSASGSAILGVRASPREPSPDERAAAVELALALRRRVDGRPQADARVHVNACVHVGGVVLHAGRTEIVGGALTRTAEWAARGEVPGLCATRAAVAGLSGFAISDGPEGLVLIDWPA
jgi:serine/threonine protein kinase